MLSFGYWTTNFVEVQRALASDSISSARKTPVIGSFPKMFVPFITIVPGMIAAVMVAEEIALKKGESPSGGTAGTAAVGAGSTAGSLDQITDWTGGTPGATVDVLYFQYANGALAVTHSAAGSATNYLELSAADYATAYSAADTQIKGTPVQYVAVQIGGDVVLFANETGTHANGVEDAIALVGKTLADIDYTNIV